MNTADIKKGRTYRSTLVRVDGATIIATVTSVTETAVYYLNSGIEMGPCKPRDFADRHVPC